MFRRVLPSSLAIGLLCASMTIALAQPNPLPASHEASGVSTPATTPAGTPPAAATTPDTAPAWVPDSWTLDFEDVSIEQPGTPAPPAATEVKPATSVITTIEDGVEIEVTSGNDSTPKANGRDTTDVTNPSSGLDPTAVTPASELYATTLDDIADMVGRGKLAEAEEAYFKWSKYWQEDAPIVLAQIEREMLMAQYRKGNFSALLYLVRAGDGEAYLILRSLVLTGGEKMPVHDYATAIRIIGETGGKDTLNTLRLALYHENSIIVNAAVEALGNLGDKRIVPELLNLFDEQNIERNLLVAGALKKLGAANLVRKRFADQLFFPAPGARERAALNMAACGFADGWNIVRKILAEQQASYYPLALKVVDVAPHDEAYALLVKALTGTEQEQLITLRTITLLPYADLDVVVYEILRDETRSLAVRLACLDLIAKRNPAFAAHELLAYAVSTDEKVDPELKAASITALATTGALQSADGRQALLAQLAQLDLDATNTGLAQAKRLIAAKYASATRAALLFSSQMSYSERR